MLLVLVPAVVAAFGSGCGGRDDPGPPTIAYGQAECDLCKMIISEERFAASMVIESPDGVRKLAVDDIGCLLRSVQNSPPAGRAVSFVHDYDTQEWIAAEEAVFVRSAELHTPMASQLAACKTPEGAEALAGRVSGTTTDFDDLARGAPARVPDR
jgi:copper chaperone NosL